MYLPFHLSAGIMLGGVVRWVVEKRTYSNDKAKEDAVQSGVLYASGLVAGEGLVGILLAVFAVFGINAKLSFSLGNIGGLVAYGLLLVTLYYFATRAAKKSK